MNSLTLSIFWLGSIEDKGCRSLHTTPGKANF